MAALWRTASGKAALATGLLAALLMFCFVDFSPDTGTPAKIVMSVFIGAFAAYGIWSFAGIPALVSDLMGMKRGGVGRVPGSALADQPRPQLSPHKQGAVRRVVKLMAHHGIFAPEPPDAAMLYEGVADWGGPVTQGAILMALGEADYWHPDFEPARCMANVVAHDSHSEQFEEALREQIADLVRLAGGALDVRDVAINLVLGNGRDPLPPCSIAMTVNGEPVALRYAPAAKYLSTHIHVALARALAGASCGKRFAWLWVDQGAYISCLADGAVEQLNAGPGLDKAGFGGWAWIDEDEPFAAGDSALQQS